MKFSLNLAEEIAIDLGYTNAQTTIDEILN